MASQHTSAGGVPLALQIMGTDQAFKLIIDSRLAAYNSMIDEAFRPTANEYEMLIASTIANWVLVMSAYLTDTPLPDDRNHEAIHNPKIRGGQLLASDGEPYVTVWNMGTGLRLSVSSNTLPSDALALLHTHPKGVQLFIKNAINFGSTIMNPQNISSISQSDEETPATNVIDMPSESSANESKEINLRLCQRLGDTKYLRLQEFVQGGGMKFEKTAEITTVPFHHLDVLFNDKDLIAYPITGKISVRKLGEQLVINIPIEGKDKLIYIDENSWEYKAIQDDLRIPKNHSMSEGNSWEVDDAYLVIRASSTTKDGKQLMKDDNLIQFKNFYHIYQFQA